MIRYVTIKEIEPFNLSVSGIYPTKDTAEKEAKSEAKKMKKGFVYIAKLHRNYYRAGR